MVTELVEQARRRYWWNEMLAQGAWALSAGMAALVILLLLGTQVLEWHWLVLLPAATLALGVYRTVRRLPSRYRVAQIVDAKLNLADAFSTAVYFDGRACRTAEELRALQRAQAEQLCDRVSIRQAVPFTTPRAVYACAALLLMASSLFALRYALERRLELQRPIARILQHALGLDQQQQAAAQEKKKTAAKRSPLEEMAGLSLPAADQQLPGQAQAADAALDASAENANSRQKNGPQPQPLKVSSGDQADGEGTEGEATDDAGPGTGNENGEGQQGNSPQNQAGKEGKSGTPPGSAGNNSSLLAKFKDAMQNLLSRMKPQSAGANGGQPQMAQNQNNRQGNPQPGNNSQGGKQAGKQSGQEESQEGQSGQDAQMAQNAQGRGAGKNGEEQSSNQPGSGIGKQDGNKDPKIAEQLAAMGKLSEIIGKRSANVSGEVTVEVQSNSQQLQTPYSQRSAAHGEAGAEISRDEVPAALQAYVQQYFEQVRKQAPASRAKN